MQNDVGWLIVGHGTRNAAGQAEFLRTFELLSQRSTGPVACAFLELAEPTIAQGIACLATQGVRRVLIVPLLLFTAGHAKDDVPAAVAEAAASHAMQVVGQTSALEDHPQLLELSRQRFCEALAGDSGKTPEQRTTALLLVGRGSSDAVAIEAVRRYTAQLAAALSEPGETAFVAVARPTVPEALERLAEQEFSQVVILPHLLFQGDVLTTIRAHAAEIASRFPRTQWLVAEHLGPHDLVVQAILERIQQYEVSLSAKSPA